MNVPVTISVIREVRQLTANSVSAEQS